MDESQCRPGKLVVKHMEENRLLQLFFLIVVALVAALAGLWLPLSGLGLG